MTTDIQTTREWLMDLTIKNSSGEKDWSKIEILLRKIGFPKAIVTCGIVYLEGKGTIEAPPTSIHTIATMLLSQIRK